VALTLLDPRDFPQKSGRHAMITVYIKNADPRRIDLVVTTVDNYASDPVPSEMTLQYGDRANRMLTIDVATGYGSVEWTASATGYADGGPTTVNNLRNGDEVPVAAGAAQRAAYSKAS
jgi:hypothetical protein